MKNVIAILAVLSLAAFAGQLAVDLDPIQNTDEDLLQYDNGTPNWVTWGGMYRGVWFNVEDFVPGESSADIHQTEYWFYHSTSYPWDTSDVYVEVWNGDAMAPTTQLDQSMLTALHYAPVFVDFPELLTVEGNFWSFANTEMSAGGWPSALGDWAGSAVSHSLLSDDFIIWEPWLVVEVVANYFFRVSADIPSGGMALDNTTWGSLKATF